MKRHIYPTDMTDRQWKCINDLIPAAKPGGRPRSLDMRQVINAILYIVVSGIQWRMLPKEYPKWQSVYYYFRRWRDDGTWQRIHDTLRAEVRQQAGRHKHPTAGALDSQSVKTTQVPGIRGYDGSKQVKGRKRHILVDKMGLLLVVVVTVASMSENAGARLVLSRLGGAGKKLRRIWVDGGYRGTLLDWAREQCRIILYQIRVITYSFRFGYLLSIDYISTTHFTSNQPDLVLQQVLRPKGQKGFLLLPRRWVAERTFAWLTRCRRLSVDYEGLPASSEAWIYIAMMRVMIRRLAPD